MREGDLSAAAGALKQAYLRLDAQWRDTESAWRDVVRERFEREHLEPLEPRWTELLKALQRLSSLAAQAREECA